MEITEITPEIQQIKQRFSIIGNAPALIFAINRAKMVAPYDQSVLITGESGAGKEFFPKIIHNFSPRKHNKYIAVNCGAIPEGTIDSELFGHEKGAFTGAIAARKGYFEEANGGTIFLDEVAELPLTTQARLLRVLENGEFIKVGSSEVQKTNIRVVAATNKDMLKAISEGKFREDLYYRLSTVKIEVPSLRDRGNDIILLSRKFAGDFSEKYQTPVIKLSESAKEMLLNYRWPGNVRQLKNVIEQVALFNAGEEIVAEDLKMHLPLYSHEYKPAIASSATYDYSSERELLFKMIFRMQKEIDDLHSLIDNFGEQTKSGKRTNLPQSLDSHDIDNIEEVKENNEFKIVKLKDFEDVPQELSPLRNPTASLEETEKEIIKLALQRNSGNRKKAAEELHISERTIYRKIKEYNLECKK